MLSQLTQFPPADERKQIGEPALDPSNQPSLVAAMYPSWAALYPAGGTEPPSLLRPTSGESKDTASEVEMSEDKAGELGVLCVVFAKGRKSYLIRGDDKAEGTKYHGKALPTLLAEGWTIRRTVAAGKGAYFVLAAQPNDSADLSQADPLEMGRRTDLTRPYPQYVPGDKPEGQ